MFSSIDRTLEFLFLNFNFPSHIDKIPKQIIIMQAPIAR